MVKMALKENSVIKGWPVYLVFLVLIGAVIWALKNQPPRTGFEAGGERFRPADVHVSEAEWSEITQGEPKSLAEIISAEDVEAGVDGLVRADGGGP